MKIKQEQFFGQLITVHQVSDEARREDDYNTCIWDHNGHILPTDVVIGLSPTNFHAFLRTNLWEVHPRFSFNKIKVLKSRPGSIRAQIFLRLRGLSEQQIQKLNAALPGLAGKRTMSCIEGVRQVLAQVLELKFANLSKTDLYISQFIFQALTKGIQQKNGDKIQVDVFAARQAPLMRTFKELTYAESCFNPMGIASYYWYKMGVKLSSNKLDANDDERTPDFFENNIKNFST